MKKLLLLITLTLSLFGGGIGVGDKAADFTLKTLDGTKSYTMQDFRGKVVLLNIWASWCSGCKKEMPEFFAFEKAHGDKISIVTISIDANAQDAKAFLKGISEEVGYTTPFVALHNPSKSMAKTYRCMGMPSSYLIDKNGMVQKVIVGSVEKAQLEELLDVAKKLQ